MTITYGSGWNAFGQLNDTGNEVINQLVLLDFKEEVSNSSKGDDTIIKNDTSDSNGSGLCGLSSSSQVIWAGLCDILYKVNGTTLMWRGQIQRQYGQLISSPLKMEPADIEVRGVFGVESLLGVWDIQGRLWRRKKKKKDSHIASSVLYLEQVIEYTGVEQVTVCENGNITIVMESGMALLSPESWKVLENGKTLGNISGSNHHRFLTITSGAAHTLGVDGNGVVWSWGSNLHGQLGRDIYEQDPDRQLVPRRVTRVSFPSDSFITSIAAGGWISAIVLDHHELQVWGWTREPDCIHGIGPQSDKSSDLDSDSDSFPNAYWFDDPIMDLSVADTYVAIITKRQDEKYDIKVCGKSQLGICAIHTSTDQEFVTLKTFKSPQTPRLYCTDWNLFVMLS